MTTCNKDQANVPEMSSGIPRQKVSIEELIANAIEHKAIVPIEDKRHLNTLRENLDKYRQAAFPRPSYVEARIPLEVVSYTPTHNYIRKIHGSDVDVNEGGGYCYVRSGGEYFLARRDHVASIANEYGRKNIEGKEFSFAEFFTVEREFSDKPISAPKVPVKVCIETVDGIKEFIIDKRCAPIPFSLACENAVVDPETARGWSFLGIYNGEKTTFKVTNGYVRFFEGLNNSEIHQIYILNDGMLYPLPIHPIYEAVVSCDETVLAIRTKIKELRATGIRTPVTDIKLDRYYRYDDPEAQITLTLGGDLLTIPVKYVFKPLHRPCDVVFNEISLGGGTRFIGH